jgi:hypothetical protein
MNRFRLRVPSGPSMVSEATVQSLSPQQQALLRTFQRVRYGRVPVLRVRAGEPLLDSASRVRRKIKVLGENAPHPMASAESFVVRREVREFFRILSELGDAEIIDLEFRDGLPISFEIIEPFCA